VDRIAAYQWFHRRTENYPAAAVRFIDSAGFYIAAEISVGKYGKYVELVTPHLSVLI
jgi:hypothetical protein